MKVSDILSLKKTLSFEFFPPKEENQTIEFVENLKGLVGLNPDFVSVTDTGYSTAKYRHLALSKILKDKVGFNVILHLTCINNTKDEIRTLLDKAKAAGIDNILALRGDKNPKCEILPGDFSFATDLLKEIDLSHFCVGVAGHPEKHPLSASFKDDMKIILMKKELGASYIITQLFYDNDKFFSYREMLKKNGIDIAIVAGLMPLSSPSALEKIESKAGKISKPPALLKIIDKYGDNKKDFFKASIEFTIRQCEELQKGGVRALHFFTFNKATAVKEIVNGLSL